MAPPPDRQVTLGKFFGMPNGGPKEERQVRVDGMFKKQAAKLNGKPEGDVKLETAQEVEMEEVGEGGATKKRAPDEGEVHGDDRPEKKVKAVDEEASPAFKAKGKGKAPKVLDSDSEDEPPKTNGKSPPKPVKMHPMFAKPAPNSVQPLSEASGSEAPFADEDGEVEEEEVASDEDDEVAGRMAELVEAGKEPAGISWENGKSVPYASLVHTFGLIEATTKRLEISKYLTQFLMRVIERTPDELIRVIYLCINRLAPDYEGIELGIGESLLIKAISESMGRSLAQVKAEYKTTGDLGTVARNSRGTQKTMFKPKPLSVKTVFADLKVIATTTGHSSQNKKVGTITKMLASCQGEEAKYIIRSLEGKLRIGLAERTVLVALAHAAVATGVGMGKKRSKDPSDLEAGANVVKAVFSELPSYDLVIPALLKGGVQGLRENCKLTPGVPLKPMLAKPTKAISEVLDRFEGKKFTCEYKYDGERAQIHFLGDGKISVFSRNSENMSVKYPDMVAQLPAAILPTTQSFVLDAEAVAWDKDERKILPFQEITKRKRKDVKVEDIKVKVHVFAFDLLYLNGEPLINTDLENRRKLLRESFSEVDGEFSFATSADKDNVEEIQAFLDESVKVGCEGLMVKMLQGENANYEPSRRSMNWLKLKKDYLAGVGDSLDLVVVGAYYGRGKRTNVYGAFLLACYDVDSETYQTICKIGTGFSEEALDQHYKALHELEVQAKRGYYDVGEAKPDVWFEPKVVWEVLAADLSLSPVYSAAKGLCGDGARGVSLRFPRYIRERDDKGPEDATGPEQVAEMYSRQVTAQQGGGRKKKGKGGDDDDGDFW